MDELLVDAGFDTAALLEEQPGSLAGIVRGEHGPDPATTELGAADHRRLGTDLFNHVWTLLETPTRTPVQIDEMIHAAHASRYHWAVAGEPPNLARGEWRARGCTPSWVAPSLPCRTPVDVSRCAKSTASAAGTLPRPTRRWPGRPRSPAMRPPRPTGRLGQRPRWTGLLTRPTAR